MKTNIALIGFMGTGKTAVGQLLAEKLSRKFIELDWSIEEQAGKTIPEIFRDDGEIAFRELEIEATRKIAGENYCVIACGGGLVLNKINTDRLRESGKTVYLTASPGIILKRTTADGGTRPLLMVDDPAGTIRSMLKARKSIYEQTADITIDTSKLDTEAVAEQIIRTLGEDESFDLQK
ncbi:MAG: shikimate kinase [Dehalococcoidales bacterium]|nr:shikimate kinase [Dehalococcoidales bacterium]MDP6633195.1 shikimate kinase [Dehalococcoidales bacterium]